MAVDIDEARAESLAREIRGENAKIVFLRADVSQSHDVQAIVALAEKEFGALHVPLNNAGIFPASDGSVLQTTEEIFDRVVSANIKRAFRATGAKYRRFFGQG